MIKSNCCSFGLGEEVHVLKEDCPVKRTEGQRKYISRNKEVKDCTCIYTSIFIKEESIAKCEYYDGVTHDKDNKIYYVNCSYK